MLTSPYRTILCFSCLNGQVKALAFQRGATASTWEKPEPVEDFAAFSMVANDADEKTRFTGNEAAIVLAHPRLSEQLVETPPVKGWTLARFLQRRVQNLKTFEGEPAWSFQPGMPTKASANATRVHILPREILEQLSAGCLQQDLRLVRVLPTTAVLGNQLRELPLEKDEVGLLAAETGPTTTVVIGRRDGRVCLGRVLRSSWNTQPDRVAVDLTRTIGFAEQQTGLAVTSIWLFGAGAETHLAQMGSLLKLPVKVSPVAATPFYWAEQGAKMPPKADGNLVSLEAREAPQRRRLLTLTALVLLILLAGALGTFGFSELRRQAQRNTIAKLDTDITRWKKVKDDWNARHAELVRNAEFVRIVSEEKPLPVPSWLLGYLGEALPDDLLLTELRIKQANNLWSVYMAGAAQPTTNPAPALVFRDAFAQLTNSLANGPFRMELTRVASVNGAPPKPAEDEESFLERLTPGTRPAPAQTVNTNQRTFVVEGSIR